MAILFPAVGAGNEEKQDTAGNLDIAVFVSEFFLLTFRDPASWLPPNNANNLWNLYFEKLSSADWKVCV